MTSQIRQVSARSTPPPTASRRPVMFYVRSRGGVVEAEKISFPYSLLVLPLTPLQPTPVPSDGADRGAARAACAGPRCGACAPGRARRGAPRAAQCAAETALLRPHGSGARRASARAQALAARPNFVARNPRYHSTRMSTGGHAPRRHFDAEFHRAQIRIATVRLELAQDEVKYFRTLLDVEEALARSSE